VKTMHIKVQSNPIDEHSDNTVSKLANNLQSSIFWRCIKCNV